MLAHFPDQFPSKIMWTCCIMTSYHTPKSSFLANYIFKIVIAIVFLVTCVPCGVHWPLIQIFFHSTAIIHYSELWSPQILYKLTNFPPYCVLFCHKPVSLIFQW